MKTPSARVMGYLLAPAAVAITALVRILLPGVPYETPMAILFVLPVALSAWVGGLGPGLLTTGLSGFVMSWYFMAPHGTILVESPEDRARLFLFLAVGILVSWLFDMVLATSRRLRKEVEARRRAEQEAVRGREALDLAIGLAGMGWWDLDAAAGRLAGSPELFQIMGLEQPGTPTVPIDAWLERVHPGDRDRVVQALEEARRLRSTFAPCLRILRADTGEVAWVDVNGRYLYDASGEPVRMIGMVRDITAGVSALEAVRESEGRFRILADNVPVLIWMNGLQGCEFVNQECLRFLGWSMEQVTGMGWVDCVHPDDRDAYLGSYERAMSERCPFDALVRLRRHDGEYRWFRSTGVPRLRDDGALLGYVGCSNDVTELMRSQEAMRQADVQKDEFLALLAHELRNPLAPLRNGVFLLRQAGDDPAGRNKALGIMQRQLSHLTRLVDDLLDVSRITRGKLELRQEGVDVSQVLQESVESVRPFMESQGHTLEMPPIDGKLPVNGDRVRLVQIVSNLLHNAAKFTSTGGHIELRARRQGDHAVISVLDNGQGIPKDMLGTVFDIFFQAPAGRLTPKGLGIGLALVKRLVELHGGTVEARSEGEGRGSEFIVRLPLAEETREVRDSEAAGTEPLLASPGTGQRVLVVDDNEDIVASLTGVLEQMGCEVRSARDGEEALAEAERFRPGVVLMDLGMPRLDGLETARRLRQRPWGRDVLLVAITGWGQGTDRHRSRAAGFDHHMVKPWIRPHWPGWCWRSASAPGRARREGGVLGDAPPAQAGDQAGARVGLLGAPAGFEATLGDLPEGARLSRDSRGRHDLTLWFTISRREPEQGIAARASSDSPAIGYRFLEVMEEAGLPPGVVNFITGPGGSVGDYLVGGARRAWPRGRSGSRGLFWRWEARTPSGVRRCRHRCRRGRGGPVRLRVSGAEVFGLLARHRGSESVRALPREAGGAGAFHERRAPRRAGQLHEAGHQRAGLQVDTGLHRGGPETEGRIVSGGEPGPSDGWFQPTVVADVKPGARLTGAMVGAHPFGGFNMSGTDSKAGGRDYLLLFTQAKSIAERVS
ncbi:MAG: aldehyde dehydrogenase family protein [Candidatus Polarisedimenticolia bacterium]